MSIPRVLWGVLLKYCHTMISKIQVLLNAIDCEVLLMQGKGWGQLEGCWVRLGEHVTGPAGHVTHN